MSADSSAVVVNILDKEYQVSCPPDQRVELQASAKHLDSHMRSIRESGKVIGLDRIAVMAALNIAHDLLEQQHAPASTDSTNQENTKRLMIKLETALQRFRQMEL